MSHDLVTRRNTPTHTLRLREIRRHKQLTQYQLAELTGIDQSSLSRIERGQRDILLSQLITIAEAMNVPLSSLLRDTP